jgi:peptidoglycan-N-acetylmuramic acid deacetylase
MLFHPTSETNASIMADLIESWREMGYSFGTLDELTKVK